MRQQRNNAKESDRADKQTSTNFHKSIKIVRIKQTLRKIDRETKYEIESKSTTNQTKPMKKKTKNFNSTTTTSSPVRRR